MIWSSGGDPPQWRCTGSPLRFSGETVSPPHPPPRLGEHTADVLARVLGIGMDTIAELRGAGVIG